jgi:Membrane domain of glycerophosphoryl diester phosphodiesterase
VTDAPRLELLRPRDLGGLFGDSFNAYMRHFPAFVAIGAAVVVPVQLIVSGIGLGQLTGGYSTSARTGEQLIAFAELYLVIAPLVTAMVVHALLAVADGERPRPGAAIVSGLEAFRPVFVAVVIAAAGVILGLFLLILPGLWLFVRWAFVPQAVVLDGRRSTQALQRSAELVDGSWWRVLGIALFAGLAAAIPAALISVPVDAVAKSADSEAISLAGQVVASALVTPFQVLMLTLLYFDLLARRRLPTTVPPVQPPV